jgi:hypothetical protein
MRRLWQISEPNNIWTQTFSTDAGYQTNTKSQLNVSQFSLSQVGNACWGDPTYQTHPKDLSCSQPKIEDRKKQRTSSLEAMCGQ